MNIRGSPHPCPRISIRGYPHQAASKLKNATNDRPLALAALFVQSERPWTKVVAPCYDEIRDD